MPTLHQYRLFISHAWAYSEGYNRLISFLDIASNFSYSNYSVPTSKAFERMTSEQLGEQIRQQIRPVQAVIILAGMYVAHSGWIQYEIDYAVSTRKPIVGIVPWGGQRVPIAVQNCASKIVAWNTSSIVSAIREVVP